MSKIVTWLSNMSKEPVVNAIKEDNGYFVFDEWFYYYRKCSNNAKKILKILDSFPDQPKGYSLTDEFWDQLIEIRSLVEIKDPEEMKEWLLHCKAMVRDVEIKKPKKEKFDIGAYKRECINKLKDIKVDSTLLIKDRIYQTVQWWVIGMENRMKEFKGKKFHVEEIDHNTQLIRRTK